MWKAREDGCSIKVRYGKVLFCGANGAGKTNFSNLLLEAEFNPIHVSTEVAKPQQATVAMKAQVSKSDKDGDVIFKKMNIDDEIQQLMSHLPEKYTKPDTTPHDQQDTISYHQQHAVNIKTKHKSLKTVWPIRLFYKNTSKSHEKVTEFNQNEEKNVFDQNKHKSVTQKHKSHTLAENIMSSKLVSSNAGSESVVTQLTDKVWDILTFMDTGGQPQYISMLPAVNSFAMITFIVHKMTGGRESLDEKFMVRHGDKDGEHSFTPYEHECTYLQLIKTLMSYASVNFFPDKSFLNDFKISYNQKQTRSISFVGTHSKNVSENDILEIDEVLADIVKNFNSKNIKVKLNKMHSYLAPVDNKEQSKSSTERDEITESLKSADHKENDSKKYTNPSRIRGYIYEWMEKQDVYTVPIQWLLLELEIRKECESRQCSLITCEDVLRIGREKSLGDDNFIKTGLRFHHLFGVLLYFEEVKGMHELVITNHRWLFEKLSEIVKYSFEPSITEDEDDLSLGIFKDSMLNKLNIAEDFKNSGINTECLDPKKGFLELLQHLLIIAQMNEDDSKYFMPSLLKSSNNSDHQKCIPGKSNFISLTNDPVSLLVQIESVGTTSSFPRGFLCFLVVQLIHSTNWELYRDNVYNNILTFFKVNGGYYVTLVDKIFFLEIIVTHAFDGIDVVPIHHEVFKVIKAAISDVRQRLNIEIKLKYGFMCKMCQDAEETHMTYSLEIDNDCCYCTHQKLTRLEMSHKVWLLAPAEVSIMYNVCI